MEKKPLEYLPDMNESYIIPMQQNSPSTLPLVSVCCITYNHEKFIREAIEGFLMQQTNFDYEIIIANDCSPDNTDIIVKEYINHHPKGKLIKYFRHEKNLGMMPNFIFALQQCIGKYIALCDGDDFWTDPLKLQKQVDFLERNEEYAVCGHGVSVVDANNVFMKTFCIPGDFCQEDLFYDYPISTLSMVFRSSAIMPLSRWLQDVFNGDLSLNVILLKDAKGYILPEIMGVHIVHEGGVWAMQKSSYQKNNFIATTNVLLKQNGLLNENSKKLILKKRKQLKRDYNTYDFINIKLFLLGKINIIAFLRYYLSKLKKKNTKDMLVDKSRFFTLSSILL